MSSNGALRTNTQLQTTFLYGFIKNNTKEDYFVIRVGSDRKQIWLGEGGGEVISVNGGLFYAELLM